MSIHINKFIDKIKATESRNLRDLTMSMTDARDLHADITKLLLAVQVVQIGPHTILNLVRQRSLMFLRDFHIPPIYQPTMPFITSG